MPRASRSVVDTKTNKSYPSMYATANALGPKLLTTKVIKKVQARQESPKVVRTWKDLADKDQQRLAWFELVKLYGSSEDGTDVKGLRFTVSPKVEEPEEDEKPAKKAKKSKKAAKVEEPEEDEDLEDEDEDEEEDDEDEEEDEDDDDEEEDDEEDDEEEDSEPAPKKRAPRSKKTSKSTKSAKSKKSKK